MVEGIEDSDYPAQVTTFLTPFDNLTWNRQRLLDLFGYHYQLELYVPKAKRRYGYYVMPILRRGQFIGRIDPKVDRREKILRIQAIYLDEGQVVDDGLIEDLVPALREFMIFHGCEHLQLDKSEPRNLKDAILAIF